MIIDFRKIARSGKGEESFFFEYTPQIDSLSIPNAEILLPVKVNGKAILTDKHSAFLEGEIVFSIKGECTRCLKETVKEFVAEFNEDVSMDDLDSYPVVNDTVDLSRIVDDKILMTIPVSFLCKEDCKGLCPVCGKNKNDGKCECEK